MKTRAQHLAANLTGTPDLTTPPAWDFHNGDLRVWQDGEVVAVFKAGVFPDLALEIVAQMQRRLWDCG